MFFQNSKTLFGTQKVLKKKNRKENKILIKIKNKFKLNKLTLSTILFKVILFVSFYYIKTKKFKILRKFDYILFSFISSTVKSNMR